MVANTFSDALGSLESRGHELGGESLAPMIGPDHVAEFDLGVLVRKEATQADDLGRLSEFGCPHAEPVVALLSGAPLDPSSGRLQICLAPGDRRRRGLVAKDCVDSLEVSGRYRSEDHASRPDWKQGHGARACHGAQVRGPQYRADRAPLGLHVYAWCRGAVAPRGCSRVGRHGDLRLGSGSGAGHAVSCTGEESLAGQPT